MLVLAVFIRVCNEGGEVAGNAYLELDQISGGTSLFCKTNQPFMEIKIDFLLHKDVAFANAPAAISWHTLHGKMQRMHPRYKLSHTLLILTLKTNVVNSNNKKIITCPQPSKDLMIVCKILNQYGTGL